MLVGPYQTERDYGDLLCEEDDDDARPCLGKENAQPVDGADSPEPNQALPAPGPLAALSYTGARPSAGASAAAGRRVQKPIDIVDYRAECERARSLRNGPCRQRSSVATEQSATVQKAFVARARTLPFRTTLEKPLPTVPGRSTGGFALNGALRVRDPSPSRPPTPVVADKTVARKPSVVKRALSKIFRRKGSIKVDRPAA